MSKRSKKKRRAKQPIASQTAKRQNLRLALGCLATAAVIALGFWWWEFKPADIFLATNPITSERAFQKLKGRWQRQDGGYVLEIKAIAADGSMDAAAGSTRSVSPSCPTTRTDSPAGISEPDADRADHSSPTV